MSSPPSSDRIRALAGDACIADKAGACALREVPCVHSSFSHTPFSTEQATCHPDAASLLITTLSERLRIALRVALTTTAAKHQPTRIKPMRKLLLATLLGATTLIAAVPAQAALFAKKPEASAEEAARANLSAVTIWVDASWGFRNQGAANSLSKAHQAFAERGYKVLSVEPYIENGDLQGFFVTYEKP